MPRSPAPQSGGRGRADRHLPARLPLDAGEQLREEADHLRVQGKLGLFEQERARTLEHCPKEADEPQGAVREVFLGLPGSMSSPVLVLASEVTRAYLVTPELQVFELGDGGAARINAAAQSRPASRLRAARDLFQEVSPVGIILFADRTPRLPDELRHDMQVSDGGQEFSDLPELPILVDLFQISLGQPLRIRLICIVGPNEELMTIP